MTCAAETQPLHRGERPDHHFASGFGEDCERKLVRGGGKGGDKDSTADGAAAAADGFAVSASSRADPRS